MYSERDDVAGLTAMYDAGFKLIGPSGAANKPGLPYNPNSYVSPSPGTAITPLQKKPRAGPKRQRRFMNALDKAKSRSHKQAPVPRFMQVSIPGNAKLRQQHIADHCTDDDQDTDGAGVSSFFDSATHRGLHSKKRKAAETRVTSEGRPKYDEDDDDFEPVPTKRPRLAEESRQSAAFTANNNRSCSICNQSGCSCCNVTYISR